MADELLIALGSFLAGALAGAAGVRYQSRADRRDVIRLRRELAAEVRADVLAASDYRSDRIWLRNDGPADATAMQVTKARCGPRSSVSDAREICKWPLPLDLPAGADFPLRVVPREAIGDWIDLTLEWTDADGTRRTRNQRINWAG